MWLPLEHNYWNLPQSACVSRRPRSVFLRFVSFVLFSPLATRTPAPLPLSTRQKYQSYWFQSLTRCEASVFSDSVGTEISFGSKALGECSRSPVLSQLNTIYVFLLVCILCTPKSKRYFLYVKRASWWCCTVRQPLQYSPSKYNLTLTAVLTSWSNCAFCSLNMRVLSSILVSIEYFTSIAVFSHSASCRWKYYMSKKRYLIETRRTKYKIPTSKNLIST